MDLYNLPPRQMTDAQMTLHRTELVADMARLVRIAQPNQADEEEFLATERRLNEMLSEFHRREAGGVADSAPGQAGRAATRDAVLNAARPGGTMTDCVEAGTRFGGGGASGGGTIRSEALRLVDSARHAPDAVRQAWARAVDLTVEPEERTRMARYIAAAGAADYERAFAKLLRDPVNGHREFTDEELRAFQRVTAEARAMNLTDAQGGYLVPATVDFAVMLTNGGAVNPVRALARKVTTTGDTWAGITSAGVTASWDAEAAEVSDDSPALASPVIPVHRGSAYVQASLEVTEDAGLAGQLAPLFVDAKDRLEATSFTLGTGSGQPKGVVTAVASTPGSLVPSSATALPLTVADVTGVQNALPPRWRPRAQWMANLSVLNGARQTPLYANGPALLGTDGRMLGWAVNENSEMDGTVTTTAADYLLIGGDFSQYVVVDRIGLTVQFVPAVFGANRRPTGEVGWFARWRTGADLVVPDAFRLLNLSA